MTGLSFFKSRVVHVVIALALLVGAGLVVAQWRLAAKTLLTLPQLVQVGDGFEGSHPESAFTVRLGEQVQVIARSGDATVELGVSGAGREGAALALGRAVFSRDCADCTTAVARRQGTFTERWESTPTGFEQTFRFEQRPAGEGALRVELTLGAPATVDSDGRGATFPLGAHVARYDGLLAYDANHTALPAMMIATREGLRLEVDDSSAVYPVVIDPVLGDACAIDADCGGGGLACQVNTQTLVGTCKGASGAACTQAADCASNFCSGAVCGFRNLGQSCTLAPADPCFWDTKCDPASLTCKYVNGAMGCTSNAECYSGLCPAQYTNHSASVRTCGDPGVTELQPGAVIAPRRTYATKAEADAKCINPVGGVVETSTGINRWTCVPLPAQVPANATPCASDTQCGPEQICDFEQQFVEPSPPSFSYLVGYGGCVDRVLTAPAGIITARYAPHAIISGAYYGHAPLCPGTSQNFAGVIISPTLGTMSAGCNAGSAGGAVCTTGAGCASGTCVAGSCGSVPGSGPCTAANAFENCQSRTCSPNGAVCIPSGAGRCAVDADCTASSFCELTDLATKFTCKPKVAAGLPAPVCPANGSTSSCLTGVCNPVTVTCALPGGSACAASGECAGNACTANVCGAAVGRTCSVNADCTSNRCNTDLRVCIPVDGGGNTYCASHAACPGGYCSSTTYLCKAAVARGAAVPTDNGSNGCPPSFVTPACAQLACSPSTGKCAAKANSIVASFTECVGDVGILLGGTTPSCGYADGAGPCTDATAPTVCRSYYCGAQSGLCRPQGGGSMVGCGDSRDCQSGEYCSPAGHQCVVKHTLAFSLSTGECPANGLTDACTSGACVLSPSMLYVCAQPAGTACATATDCGGVACTANKCGQPSGTACTVANQAVVCASKTCDAVENVCVPAVGGCANDATCSVFSYCDAVKSTFGQVSWSGTFTCQPKLANGASLPQSTGPGVSYCTAGLAPRCASGLCTSNGMTSSCVAPAGEACTQASQCAAGVCNNGVCGRPNGASGCTVSSAAAICLSGFCSSSGYCVPSAGACAADTDCTAGNYCAVTTNACKPKVADGQVVPADGRFAVCTVTSAASQCLSGGCDPRTNLCHGGGGASCTQASDCASGNCSGNGLCGFPSFTGACTAGNALATCQAGACSPSGVCVPAGQCANDADCPKVNGQGQFCHATTHVCTAAAMGTVMPASVTCPASGLTAACSTGLCLASNNTCAPGPYGYCTTGTQCASESCVANSCFAADGVVPAAGACTADNAVIRCASGLCNTTTGACAGNASSACTSAAQCASGACVAGACGVWTGGSCTAATALANCRSGLCSTSGTCLQNQGTCAVDADCAGFGAYYCASGYCSAQVLPGTAVSALDPGHNTCPASTLNRACTTGFCNATTGACAGAAGEVCTAASSCASNVCAANGRCGNSSYAGACTASNASATCQSLACAPVSGTCLTGAVDDCAASTDCGANQLCASHVCRSGKNTGDTCATNVECLAGVCDTNGKCGALAGGACTIPNQAIACQSGACSANGTCRSSATGCYLDGDCAAGTFCNKTGDVCAPKLASGAALPADGLHAACAAGNTNGACVSGSCNATTLTCASANGENCSAANQCVVNLCAADGKCGVANGGAGCSGGRAAVCRSAACSATADACVPAQSGACFADADCAGATFCDRANFACVAKLAAGTAIPTDGLHAGTCASAVAVCGSGACNSVTSTCAVATPGACTADNQCVVDKCTGGQCGFGSGQGACTAATAASVCQSATCSSAGACMPALSGGCYVDADCASAAQYCNRSTFSCVARLSVGVAIPNDGLHGGLCTAQTQGICASGACNASTNTCALPSGSSGCTGNAQCELNLCVGGVCGKLSGTGPCAGTPGVCISGLCNTITDTCGAAAGEVCTAANGCAGNQCASNGKCGLPDGTATCTAANAATVCQSHVCSTDGTCISATAGSCHADADCTGGLVCDRTAMTCVARRADGVALPQDGLHASCASGTNAACVSGLCNATTGTCGGALNATCSSAAFCAGNLCGSNGKCGAANGAGACSAATAATICQSATCSADGTCIPSTAGSCHADADCTGATVCNRTAMSCVAKLAAGATLPQDGLHGACTAGSNAACTSGLCNATTGTCGGAVNASCTSAATCANNLCAANGKCGRVDGTASCTAATAATTCQSGACSLDGTCIPSGAGRCFADADCTSAQACNRSTFTCGAKLAAGIGLPADGLHDTCPGSGTNAVCLSGACNATTNTCGAPVGGACTTAASCANNLCDANGKCGRADGAGPCTSGDAATVCQSGTCSPGGVCVPAGPGHCSVDAECTTAQACDRTTLTCVAKLASGSPLPQDGLHDACPSTLVNAACASGLCNATTRTCAALVGATCTTAAACTNDVCGTNGKCGFVDGDGACTAANQGELCQSGACSPGGVCVPAGPDHCTADADCQSAQACSRSTFTCVAKLAAGAALPADGLHDTCPGTRVNAACSSGRCNETTTTCGAELGAPCTTGAQCEGNACGADQRCGLVDDEPGCTQATAALVCRSGGCSSTGACSPGGACSVDADCAATQFCQRDARTCSGKLAVGLAIPNDGLHGGVCTAAIGAAVCATGGCNAKLNTCGADLLVACASTSDCNGNVCGENARCGIDDGKACDEASAGLCQSGVCNVADGVCVKPQAVAEGGGLGCTSTGGGAPWVVFGAVLLAALGRRRRAALSVAVVSSAVLVLGGTRAEAQTETRFALDRFDPAEAGSAWTSADSLDLERFALRASFDYANEPLRIRESSDIVTHVVSSQATLHLGGAWSPLSRLRLTALLPVQLLAMGDSGVDNTGLVSGPSASFAVGDLRIGATWRFTGERSPVRLAAGLRASFPTGQRAAYAGDAVVSLAPFVAAAGHASSFQYAARLGARLRTAPVTIIGGKTLEHELAGTLAAGWNFAAANLLVGPELQVVVPLADAASSVGTATELMLGAHWGVTRSLRLHAYAGTGFGGALGVPAFRAVLGLEWTPGGRLEAASVASAQ